MGIVADHFVTEVPNLRSTFIKGIHEISVEGHLVRIFTYDQRRHGVNVERQVNADLLMNFEDLLTMLSQVYQFAFHGPTASIHREMLIALREKQH